MKRIDAEALRSEYAGMQALGVECRWSDVLERIDAAPEAQVRCAACRHCYELAAVDPMVPYAGGPWWYCEVLDTEHNVHNCDPERWYCADVERREEGDEWLEERV